MLERDVLDWVERDLLVGFLTKKDNKKGIVNIIFFLIPLVMMIQITNTDGISFEKVFE